MVNLLQANDSWLNPESNLAFNILIKLVKRYIYIYIYIYIYTHGAFNKFPDIFVQALKLS